MRAEMDIRPDEQADSGPRGAVVSITVGVDGRLYCHDIVPELVEVLSAVCEGDAQLGRRIEAIGGVEIE